MELEFVVVSTSLTFQIFLLSVFFLKVLLPCPALSLVLQTPIQNSLVPHQLALYLL
jgi:hypothetical protein